MRQGAAMSVEGPSRRQDEPVTASLRIGELDLVAGGKRPAGLLDHPVRLAPGQARAKAWSRSLAASTP